MKLYQVIVSYEDFLEACMFALEQRLGNECSIQLNTILKNNSISMDGIVIRKHGEKISPTIYLQEYYVLYEEGICLDAIVDKILEVYYDKVEERKDLEIPFEYEQLKDRMIYRLVNAEKNKELLETCPHIRFLDLAITFHCLVQEGFDTIGTIRITNEHLEVWEVSKETIMEQAIENTPKLLPPLLRNMETVIRDMMQEEYGLGDEAHIQLDTPSSNAELYVLSNTKGINGASCMLYPNIMKECSSRLQSDLYILPSSIHEVILLPAYERYEREYLETMVTEINHTQVALEEVLSNRVYYYSRAEDQIQLLAHIQSQST